MKTIFQTLALSIACSLGVYAQSDTTSIDDFSLEDLMSIEVVSATKTSMSIQEAPSIVRVFTKSDFEKFGFYTLKDVLNSVPGMQIQEYRAGHQLVWIRGVQARYNNKVLLMIDNIPMRDAFYGNFNIDEMIDLNTVEKIEILNGPGSVLYGANSFSGVISITTKKEGKEVGARVGSFNSYKVDAQYSTNNFYAAGSINHTDGFQPQLMSDGKQRDVNQAAGGQNLLLKYKNSGFEAIGAITNYGQPYKYRSTNKEYYFDRTPIYGALKYNREVGEKGTLKVMGYANYYQFTRNKIKYMSSTTDSIKEKSTNYLNTMMTGFDIDYNYASDKHDLIVGVSWFQDQAFDLREEIYEDDNGAINPVVIEKSTLYPDITRNTVGFFAQELYRANEYINFIGGVRFDVLSDFENRFNYRVGVTGKTKTNLYGKILFGTAYRVPAYREYIDAEAPNEILKPEVLQTLEIQVGYLFEKADLNLTFFNNNYSDFITEIVVDSVREADGSFREVDDEMSFNFDSRNITGLELNLVLRPSKSVSVNLGGSYFLSAKETLGDLDPNVFTSQVLAKGEEDIVFLSSFSGFALINYTFLENYRLGMNFSYFGDRKVPSDYQTGIPTEVVNKSNADGFVLLDLVGSAKIGNKLRAHAKVSNLLGTQVYSPPFGGQQDYDTEWTGLTFTAGLRFSF